MEYKSFSVQINLYYSYNIVHIWNSFIKKVTYLAANWLKIAADLLYNNVMYLKKRIKDIS